MGKCLNIWKNIRKTHKLHYIACNFFLFQCRAVAKRLTIAEKSRETLTEELKLANQNITRLQVLADVLG